MCCFPRAHEESKNAATSLKHLWKHPEPVEGLPDPSDISIKGLDMGNIPAVTTRQIRVLDKKAIEAIGIPSIVLMENAGRAVFRDVISRLKKRKKKFVCVVCGIGHNAGDGFVAARHLLKAHIPTEVFLIGRARDLKNDAAVNYQILRRLHCPVNEIHRFNKKLSRCVDKADVVIDAIFGVGLNRRIKEPFKSIIEGINAYAGYVIAVDVPSGLDATTGKIQGVCVKAARTVTFSLPKKGFFKNDGPHYTGQIIVADIGIPKGLISQAKYL